jgi:hypothetical protein
MHDDDCRTCGRVLPGGSRVCWSCVGRRPPTGGVARLVVLLGVCGVPLFIAGTLGLDGRLCLAGAVISGVAAVIHVVLTIANG